MPRNLALLSTHRTATHRTCHFLRPAWLVLAAALFLTGGPFSCAAEKSAKDEGTEESEDSAKAGGGEEAGSGESQKKGGENGGDSTQMASSEDIASAVANGTALAAGGAQPWALSDIRHWLKAGDRDRVISGLRFSIDHYDDDDDIRAARYILGHLLTDDLNPEGLQYLEQLPEPFEDFEDLRLLWLARAQVLAGHKKDAVTTMSTLLKEYPRLDIEETVRLERARMLHDLGNTDEAIDDLRKVAKARAPYHLRARAMRQEADWTEDEDRKRQLHYQLLRRFPTQPATREEGLLVSPDDLSETARWNRAEELYDEWAYKEAREEFKRYVDHDKHGYEAAWNIGVISLRKLRDDPVLARKMLKKVYSAGGRHKEQALYYIFRSHMKQNDYDKALEIADEYDKVFPRGEYSGHMSYYRGWLPYDQRNCEEALPNLREHTRNHGYKRSVVWGFYAWCYIRMEDWEGAVDAFGQMANRYGNSVIRGKAWYWQAYALNKLGRNEEALDKIAALRDRYPITYYDILGQQLAAKIEGRDQKASKLPWPEGGGGADEKFAVGDEAWSWPDLSGSLTEQYSRVRRLIELGEVDRARDVYRDIRSNVEARVSSDKRKQFIRFMGRQVEDYHHGYVKVGGHLTHPGTPDAEDIDWVLAYPRAYEPLVERLADDWGIPGHFVYAIMRQESRYRPRQISGADAVGALQMIPRTAIKVGKDLGMPYDPRTFPRPGVGFLYSFYYMKMHYDMWNQQIVPTAASYNGGPAPIARWIRENKGEPMAVLIEEFAYNESRIYCRKATEHMLRYLYLYEEDPEVRGRWLDSMFPVDFDYDIPDDVQY